MLNNSALPDPPMVSVVITCYNNQTTILKAIQSVIDQTYKNLQIIVVDDCSTDQSRDVVSSVSDPRFKLISLPKNGGVSSTRNMGYRNATGAFITQLDGDDFLHPEKIKNEVTTALQNPGSAVFSKYVVVQDGRKIFRLADLSRKSSVISYAGLLYRTEYLGRDWLIPAAVLQDHSFDENISLYEDWKFAIHVARRCKVLYVNEVGTYYVKFTGSLSSKPWADHRSALNNIFFEFSENKLARFIFVAINQNMYFNKAITAILNWTRAFRFFPV